MLKKLQVYEKIIKNYSKTIFKLKKSQFQKKTKRLFGNKVF